MTRRERDQLAVLAVAIAALAFLYQRSEASGLRRTIRDVKPPARGSREWLELDKATGG